MGEPIPFVPGEAAEFRSNGSSALQPTRVSYLHLVPSQVTQSEGAIIISFPVAQAALESNELFQPELAVQPPLHLVAADSVLPQDNIIEFPQRMEEKPEVALLEGEEAELAGGLKHLQKDWIQEEGEFYLLPGTGFDVKGEVERLCKNLIRAAGEGKEYKVALHGALFEIVGNVYGFSLEYLRSKAMLPFKHKIVRDESGNLRLRPFGYDGFLSDAISPQERYGAVVRSVSHLEEKLSEVGVGDIFVMTSPLGWTGFEGKRYVETQTKLLLVEEEEGEKILKGHTIRSMMNVDQNITFMNKVGADTTGFFDPNEKQQLAAISEAVKHLSGEHGMTITSLTRSIQEIVGTDIAFEGYSFNKIYDDIENFDEGFAADQLVLQHCDQLEAYIGEVIGPVWNTIVSTGEIPDYIIEKLWKAKGMTILRLSHAIDQEKGGKLQVVIGSNDDLGKIMRGEKQLGFNAKAEAEKVAEKPGCNGGGKKEGSNGKKYMIVVTANGARLVEFDGQSYDYDQPGPCRECGRDILCGPCQMCLECDIKKRDEEETPMVA